MHYTNAIVVFGFTFVHYFSKFFHIDKELTIKRFSSVVGGISIAYIFFHLLPNLIHAQADIASTFNLSSTNAFQLIFATIFLGLIVFYLLEIAMESSKLNMALRKLQHENMPETSFEQRHKRVFWAHIASYGLYNIIVGILLADQRFVTTTTAIIYLLVIGLHLLTNDWVLRHHFTDLYDKYGRVLISLTVFVGWFIGFAFHINHAFITLLEAFVAGGIILNAIKDELPECKGGNSLYFMAGTALYAFVLLFIQ